MKPMRDADGNRLHIRRKDREMDRREVLAVIAAIRRLRDHSRRNETRGTRGAVERTAAFCRGMAEGYAHAAHVLWSEYENGRS